MGYIERQNTRPQENYITELGESTITKNFLEPTKELLLYIYDDMPQLKNENTSNGNDHQQLKLRQIIIQKTLHLIMRQIDRDLQNISEFITKEQYDDITTTIRSSIEHILSLVFQKLLIELIPSEKE